MEKISPARGIKFKLGDKLLCVRGLEQHRVRNPILGKVYKVKADFGDHILVSDDWDYMRDWFIKLDKATRLERCIYGIERSSDRKKTSRNHKRRTLQSAHPDPSRRMYAPGHKKFE